MKKREFTKIMKELISIRKDEDNLNKAFKKFEPDFNYISFNRYEDLVVKAVELAMEDECHQWISYWLYDLNEGKNSKKMKVTSKGRVVPMKTISNLYDCIKTIK